MRPIKNRPAGGVVYSRLKNFVDEPGDQDHRPQINAIRHDEDDAAKNAARIGLATDDFRCLHVENRESEFGFVFVRDLSSEELARITPREVVDFYKALEREIG